MNTLGAPEGETRSRCISLLFACPAHKDRPDCPLSEIRHHFDMARRIQWLRQVDPAKLRTILHHHSECCKTSEA